MTDSLITIVNTCYLSSVADGINNNLIFYSHLIPVFFALGLSLLVFFKAKKSIFSRIFLAFSTMFSLWLIGDLITWVSRDYHLIYSVWSILVYLEILFYVLGLYFVLVLIRRTDVNFITKAILFFVTLIPFYLTVSGNSVTGFSHAICEASNNIALDKYKLYLEILILIVVLFYTGLPFWKKYLSYDKKSAVIILGSIFLFLSVFGIAEYLASVTGNYEIHLYSLFVIPIFLIAITYAIFNLDVFNLKIVSTYFLVFGFLILTGSQLLFVTDSTDRFLTALTLVLSVILMIFLFKNLHKESEQRIHIEKLSEELFEANDKLKGLDKLKTEFLSLASHQLRSPLTAINGYVSMLLAGDFGEVNDKQKDTISRVYESSKHLTKVVNDLLNVSKIEQGGMQYVMVPFDFEKAAKEIATDLSITASNKGLKINFETDNKSPYKVNGDMEKIRQVIINLIDNSIKYTNKGGIDIKLTKDESNKKTLLSITDTGMGIPKEIIDTLFQKFSRGDGARMNTGGSGLGLYLAKTIITAHKGKVWAESKGALQGSTFYIELNLA